MRDWRLWVGLGALVWALFGLYRIAESKGRLEAEDRHQVELAQHRRRFDSLVDLAARYRLQAEAYVIIATRERRTADSLRGIKHEHFTHAADIALRDAGLDSLVNVLLTEP